MFITPTEFLDVRYGAPLKEALLNWCDIDELIVLEMDRAAAFDGVLTTSAITIATKRERATRRLRMTEAQLNGSIVHEREVHFDADETSPRTRPGRHCCPRAPSGSCR